MLDLQEKFARYEELSILKKDIEKEINDLKPEVTEAMQDDDQFDTERGGKFTIRFRSNFSYSDEVQTKEDELKQLKKHEEIEGIAIDTPTRYIQYNSPSKKAE